MDGLIGLTRMGSIDRLIGLMDRLIGLTRIGSIDRLIGLMDGLIGLTQIGSIDRLIGLIDWIGLIGLDLGFEDRGGIGEELRWAPSGQRTQ